MEREVYLPCEIWVHMFCVVTCTMMGRTCDHYTTAGVHMCII